jgi:ABC-type polysaccharide/polyol phosphate export permease
MRSYLLSIWRCRYFWLSLVKIDLRDRYRRSVIGVGWSLLRPLLSAVILCTVLQRIFHRQDWWSYTPELLAGLVAWDYLVSSAKAGCHCFLRGECYIRQQPAPLAIYPLRTALGEMIHFLMALGVVLGLVWSLQGFRNLPVLIYVVPTLVLLFFFAWSLALMAGAANVYYQDVQHLTDVAFQVLFYLTPIIYRVEDLGPGRLGWLVKHCNPFVPFLHLIRDTILEGQRPAMATFVAASAMVCLMMTGAACLCARMERRLIFHL